MAASLLLSLILLLSVLSSNSCCALEHRISYANFTIVNVFPHDPKAFTQGLLYYGNDTLFESTGLYGQSSVRKVALLSGKVQIIHKMDDSLFGEGLTLFNKRLYQVTWLRRDGFIYDPKNSNQVSVSRHVIYYKGHQVYNLNELEYINGEVWANVLPTDCIVRISPNDGRILGWILLQNLKKELVDAGEINESDVLNGIAWDGEQKRLFVTGKLWPKLYEIKVNPIKTPIDEVTIEELCLPEPYYLPQGAQTQ
ncbi:hypothetical protein V8G54_013315 [Vigna mungo]|uniref:Glutaminyl-peptide cyclotransferase n=1 Tax=Vigna mungo TaxID=3915 RepID=A0AAQ3NTG6_VIGMU